MGETKPAARDSKAIFKSQTRRRFLRGTLGTAASVTVIAAASGVAAAHFPVRLDIDIQPKNEANFIDLDEHKSVAVAVHPTEFLNSDGERETFDPTAEAVRYRFGSRFALDDGEGARPVGDGEVMTVEGENGDGHDALVLTFPVAKTGLDGGEETAWLYWERDESGEHGYAGVDSVRIYGTGTATRDAESEASERELFELFRRLITALTTSG
ncbi:hypothetical protein [Halorussus sp. AFM4]|uniref:hypothetical protein n=1 Tax=Halorussus sp. AFM4 TaxID=3421651 RepID=UPI003EBFC1D3